ncbi:hypothetical protein XENORESO_001518 [Xenotaenia resolanae]|uniref:Uncharacterized protein n=1 Tax=Xenotaenia resolanae TaxID=208358 RepID=A0ABV0WIB6_9TELE
MNLDTEMYASSWGGEWHRDSVGALYTKAVINTVFWGSIPNFAAFAACLLCSPSGQFLSLPGIKPTSTIVKTFRKINFALPKHHRKKVQVESFVQLPNHHCGSFRGEVNKLILILEFILKRDFRPLSKSPVVFLLSPGEVHLRLSVVQEWLSTRSVPVVAHIMDTSMYGGSSLQSQTL